MVEELQRLLRQRPHAGVCANGKARWEGLLLAKESALQVRPRVRELAQSSGRLARVRSQGSPGLVWTGRWISCSHIVLANISR